MEKYDIVLSYEIINREIESICLLKRELERRGYSVGICRHYATFFETPEPIEAEVFVVPAYYSERSLYYASTHLKEVRKIVNLRWEQVFNNHSEDDPNCVDSIKEWGRDVVHIAWGPFPYKRMVEEWRVPKQNVKLTGSITLDFLREKLKKYYDNKETVFKRYGLPLDKRSHLFISSFSYASMDKNRIDNLSRSQPRESIYSFADVSKKSQSEIINWFEQILENNPDDIIIYRPHPEENGNLLLEQLKNKQPRFFVISEESVKQWILICDRIYSWYSTSVAEVYAAEKGCTILRPFKLPYDHEMRLFCNTPFVESYESFKRSFNSAKQTFDIPIENLKRYYFIDNKKYSYELVCDAIEEVYKSDKYLLNKSLDNAFAGSFLNKERLKNIIKRFVAKSAITNMIYKKNLFNGTKFRYLLDDVMYVKEKLKRNYASEEEIDKIINKLDMILR